MKKIVIVFLLFNALNLQAQDQKQALDSFNSIVNKFSDFIKSPQKLIYKQTFSKSPSGFVVEILEYSGSNLSYDIKKTESIVSPFVGFIEIDFISKNNSACGNVSYTLTKYKHCVGWDTEKGALDNAISPKCYEPQIDVTGKPESSFVDRVRFTFAYQNNNWVFKSVDRPNYGNSELAISGALGLYPDPVLPLTNKESREFNEKWLTLIN